MRYLIVFYLLLLPSFLWTKNKPQIKLSISDKLSILADRSSTNPKTGNLIFHDNVTINYEDIHIKTQKLTLNIKDKSFYTKGKSSIRKFDIYLETDEPITGNNKTKTFKLQKSKGKYRQLHYIVDNIILKNHIAKLNNVKFSTCECPGEKLNSYHFTVKTISINIKDRNISLDDTWFYLYRLPLVKIPNIISNLRTKIPFRLNIAYRDQWGLYERLTYLKQFNKNTFFSTFFEFREKRGYVNNINYKYTAKDFFNQINLTYGYDRNQDFDFINSKGEKIIARNKVEEDKFSLQWHYRQKFSKRFKVEGRINFITEYNANEEYIPDLIDPYPQVFSNLNFFYEQDNYTISLHYRPRINRFSSVIETTPELILDTDYLPIFFNTYYKGFYSLGRYSTKFRETDDNNPQVWNDYASFRIHTQNSFFVQLKHKNWLNITPYASLRWNYYNNSSNVAVNQQEFQENIIRDDLFIIPTEPFNNYNTNGIGINRLLFEYGIRTSFTLKSKSKIDKNSSYTNYINPYILYYQQRTNSPEQSSLYFTNEDLFQEQNILSYGFNQKFIRDRYNHKKEILDLDFSLNSIFRSSLINENTGLILNTLVSWYPTDKLNILYSQSWNLNRGDTSYWNLMLKYKYSKDFNAYISYHRQNDANYPLAPSTVFGDNFNLFPENGFLIFRQNENISGGMRFYSNNYSTTLSFTQDLKNSHLSSFSWHHTIHSQCIDYKIKVSESTSFDSPSISFSILLKHLKF